ncbi:MAG: hypothetical protein DI551_11285 [Micavibrio aeruginosavorus]|uniref:Type IV secretion protein DotA n=1 Tax=Micavibrio aeruginosavorus TaxID=349221 RepID=A0A2W5PH34_9BACT|nr:MAG: hypothetical protein DI551_11285 [Micavibrio aeruginosavorus]
MTDNTQKINAKSVMKYMLLPGILPRAKAFGNSGFGYIAFLFANIFNAVRILPPNHPFTNPSNIGTFTIRQVIATAANNIEFSKKNIDQLVVFFTIMIAITLMFVQFILLILALLSSDAFAQAAGAGPFQGIFETQYPQYDIAFLLLDYVFGIPSLDVGGADTFFGSTALQATGGPTPFHQGLHALFNFYNLAILLVAALVFIYYIIVVVVETASSGVPFGRRFAKLYAPFRLIAAVGLLVPFGYGFNAAQYITLYAAKMGSSMATNGWIVYNRAMNEGMGAQANPTGAPSRTMVARPRTPPIDELAYFGSVYHACREMYAILVPRGNNINPTQGICVGAYVIVNGQARTFAVNNSAVCQGGANGGGAAGGEYTYDQAKTDFGQSDMEVVLGEYDPVKNTQYAGSVNPLCGKVTLSLNNDNPSIHHYVQGSTTGSQAEGGAGDQDGNYGVRALEYMYFKMMIALLTTGNAEGTGAGNTSGVYGSVTKVFQAFGERAAHQFVPTCRSNSDGPTYPDGCTHNPCFKSGILDDADTCGKEKWSPGSTVFQDPLEQYKTYLEEAINSAYSEYTEGMDLRLTEILERRGWGGAGIWYNHIADINGVFTGAIYAQPTIRQWPAAMEFVRTQRQKQDKSAAACKTFNPKLSNKKSVEFTNPTYPYVSLATNGAYEYFNCEKANQGIGTAVEGTTANAGNTICGVAINNPNKSVAGMTSNIFIDIVSVIFGLNGLFDLKACSELDPATGLSKVHPLAMLSTIGKSLVENSIRSMAMALGAAFGGGMAGILSAALGAALKSASAMFLSIAQLGLTVGFILYYILPFLPFIYFFFAVGSWVKSIFEAMVGVPLWALAHLRIDGDGLPGRSAMAGYFLIFEIFVRPILIVFGLIAGMATFSAMVIMLSELFDLVVLNMTGVEPSGSAQTMNAGALETFRRGVIDQFFFTVMYAVLVYIIATTSFKMIDTIPAMIMRWMGSGVNTFNDNKQDAAQGLSSYVAIGGRQLSGQIMGGLRQGAETLGDGIRTGVEAMKQKPSEQ